MQELALERIEVGHRGAALQAALRTDRASLVEQGLDQAGLAGRALADDGERPYGRNLGWDCGGRRRGHGALLWWPGRRRA